MLRPQRWKTFRRRLALTAMGTGHVLGISAVEPDAIAAHMRAARLPKWCARCFYGGVADDDVRRICDMLHWLMR
jgi:hypothetical protein